MKRIIVLTGEAALFVAMGASIYAVAHTFVLDMGWGDWLFRQETIPHFWWPFTITAHREGIFATLRARRG